MRTIRATKGRFAVLTAVVAMSMGAAAPASAQVDQDGLVNVNVTDNTVQIPIGLAANVCGVSAAVLSEQIGSSTVDCTALADADAMSTGGGGGGQTTQNGLVNVNVEDNVLQVPVSIAANVCGIGVGVLSRQLGTSDVECDARSDSSA